MSALRSGGLVGRAENEEALVAKLIDWLKEHTGMEFLPEAHSEPPDGVLRTRDGSQTVWVEVVRVFWSDKEAAYLNQPGRHKKSVRTLSLAEGMARAVLREMRKKLEEKDYSSCVRQYGGPGYLLLAEADPFFDSSILAVVRSEVEGTSFSKDRGCFKTALLYVTDDSNSWFEKLPYSGPDA